MRQLTRDSHKGEAYFSGNAIGSATNCLETFGLRVTDPRSHAKWTTCHRPVTLDCNLHLLKTVSIELFLGFLLVRFRLSLRLLDL